MVASRVEGEVYFQIDNDQYNEELNKIVVSILPCFDKMIKAWKLFNLIFLVIGVAEFIALISFFSFLVESSLVAFSLAAVILTSFSYFMLRVYFQARKPEQLENFKERYSRGCKAIIKYRDGIPEHHVALANAYSKLSKHLQGREYQYFKPPSWFRLFSASLEKYSCWCFWEDVHKMQELLLQNSIQEHIKLVQCEPTSLDIHAALANAYVALSGLYLDPRKAENYEGGRWIPRQKYTMELEEKFRATAEKAIEEFKILNEYAPNDPWVHMQLAYSYRDLQMSQEETAEYEMTLKLRPDDKDTLFKLGRLYFMQGRNADGLKVYERLKHSNYKKAEQLISFYGALEGDFQQAASSSDRANWL